jgi:formylglycine-generating enzyme required for sulfatase activity
MPNLFGVKNRYRIGADDWQILLGMARISAGPFQMGDALVGATPGHTVTVSAFAMDKWEVSIELWKCVQAKGKRATGTATGGLFCLPPKVNRELAGGQGGAKLEW